MGDINTLSWIDGDAITAEKLQTMVDEIRKIRTDLPIIKIQDKRNNSVLTSTGNNMKILTGCEITATDPNSQIIRGDVKFAANSFSPGNAPIVIAQLATLDRVRSFCTVTGWGAAEINPTSSGFSYWVAHQILPPNELGEPVQYTMARPQLVFWIAIGY